MLRKTDKILQNLAARSGQAVGEIAVAIGETDEGANGRVGALLGYLQGRGMVSREGGPQDSTWSITPAGRQWIADLEAEEDGRDQVKPKKPAAKRAAKAKAKRERAADPEKLAPLPRKKLQSAAAVLQPAAAISVEPTPLPTAIGRQLAIRDDGAVLLIEDDVVITTLIPEDALRIARVIQTLGARV